MGVQIELVDPVTGEITGLLGGSPRSPVAVQKLMTGLFAQGGLTVANPTAVVSMFGAPLPCTIWCLPVADTITVTYSVDDGATYRAWPNGAVTAYSEDTRYSAITHVKFVATAGNANNTYGVL